MASPSSPSFAHTIRNFRYRLLLSILAAILIYFLMPLPGDYWDLRLILAYVGWASSELLLIAILMSNSSAHDTMLRSRRLEPSNFGVLVMVCLLSGASLVAIALMLKNSHNRPVLVANFHIGLSLLTIFLSWFSAHTYFAMHYARIYYGQKRNDVGVLADPKREANEDFAGGLEFPTINLADYWDFLYYSFTIAMCFQTSDISVSSTTMRRVTLVHSILSFIYVSCILGLVVNLVSNLV